MYLIFGCGNNESYSILKIALAFGKLRKYAQQWAKAGLHIM